LRRAEGRSFHKEGGSTLRVAQGKNPPLHRGLVGRFGGGFGHEFFGGGDGLIGGDFGAGFVDVVNVEDAVHRDNGGARFGAGAFVHVNVLGGKIVVVAVDDDGGLFALHGDFEKTGERDDAFVDAVPMPGNDAARGELDFDDGGAFVGVAAQGGEGGAGRGAVDGGIGLAGGFADNGFVAGVLRRTERCACRDCESC